MANSMSMKYIGGLGGNTYSPCSLILGMDKYETDGVTVVWKRFTPEIILGCEIVNGDGTYIPRYDMTTNKIKLFKSADGIQVSKGPITPITIHLTAFGIAN